MSTTKRRIEYELGLSIDNTGLSVLKDQLAQLRLNIKGSKEMHELTKELQTAYQAADQLTDILDQSYNSKLGQLDLSKVRNEINKAWQGASGLQSALSLGGKEGATAFNSFSKAVLNTNVNLKQGNELLNEMATSFKNTVKWGISSSVFNSLTSSLQKAWDYSVKLDSSLNDIRIVTGKSADEMERFAKVANTAAKNLGASTRDYTEAALIYYQQGDSDATAQAKADVTLKTANVTGQSGQEVSEQLTAVWNGYKVSADEAELYIDKLAAVAASTASDLEELATGMSKVASAANIMGVDVDQLNATLATVVSVTRQAPESVGTAFKTIYARMGDIEAGLDAETTLGSYTEKMKEIAGINVLDTNGQLRDMGEVIEEVGAMWGTLSREQQVALSQTMAGTRQYNNLLALFDNWGMYTDALNTSADAAGELQRQQDIYMDSTAAHLQKLSTEAEKTYDILFDTDSVNSMADAVTGLMSLLNGYLSSFGGGLKTISGLALTVGNIFGNQIGEGLSKTAKNWQEQGQNKNASQLKEEILNHYAQNKESLMSDGALQYEIESTQKLFEIQKMMSEQEQKDYIDRQREIAQLEERVDVATQYKKVAEDLKKEGLMEIKGVEVTEADFDEAIDKISNTIEQIEGDKRFLAGEGTRYTKSGIEREKADFEKQWKKDHGGSTKGMRKDSQWKSYEKELQNILKYEELGVKQADIFEAQRNDILFTYATELNAKRDLNQLTREEDDLRVMLMDDMYEQNLREETRLKLAEYQEAKLKDQQIALNKLEKGSQGLADAQANTTPELIQNVEQMKRYQQATYEAKIEQEKLTETVKGMTALGSIFMTLTGSLSALSDETASTEDKIKTMLTGAISIGVMVITNWKSITSMGPGLIVMLNSATVALGGSTAGVTTLTGAIGALWTALVPFLPIILAVVAALAVLTVAVVAGVKAWNKDADAMKAANEQMDAAVDRFNKLNEEAKQLKETLEGYNEALKNIENMTTATEGFEEALESANAKAKELIETYGLYGEGDWSYGDKGQIVISDEAQARIQAQADQKAHTAEKQMYGAKIYAGQATLKSQTTDLRRDIGYVAKYHYDENGNKQYGKGKDAYGREYQEGSEQFSNDDLQAVGDAFNSLGEELELLSDEQLKDTLLAMDDLPEAVRGNIDAIIENRDELEVLAKSMSDTAAAADFYAKQMLENSIEEKYGAEINKLATTKDASGKEVVNEGRANLITSILANEAQDQSDAMSKELQAIDVSNASSNNKLNKKYGYEIENDEDLARTYAEKVLGYSEADAAKLTYDGGWNKGTLKDKSGEKILDGYSDDYMREELARIAKEEEITNKYKDKLDGKDALDNISNIIGAGSAAGAKYGTDFTDAFLQSMANGDKKIDLSSSFAELDPEEVESIMALDNKDVASALGMDEEDWKDMGYASSAEFGEAFKAGLTDWEWDRDAAVSAQAGKIDLEKYDLEKEELEDYAKHLMNVSDESGDLADSLETDAEAATKVAKSVMRMNNGVEELAENFDDWKDVMEKSSKESEEYHEALSGMQNAVADLLDTEEDYVSDDFLQSHFEDIEKAAEGDAEAIDRLKQALAEDIIMKVAISNDVSAEKQAEIKTWIQEIQDMSKDIEIGANIDLDSLAQDEQKLMETMQNIIAASGMTAEEANAAFSSMGFQTNFAMEEVPVEQTVPNTITETKILEQKKDFFGNVTYQKVRTNTYQDGVDKFTGTQMQIAMETSKDGKKVPKLASVVKTGTGAANNWSKKNSGGGAVKSSSGSKPKQEKHLESELDIYHDVNVELGKISSSLDKVQSSTDQLVGQSKIENLAEQYALLNSQIDTTAEKIDIARGEMSDLAKDLAGKGIKFDKDGTISNYAEAYNQQLAYVNSIIDRYNGMSSEAQEAYQETYDKAKEDFDKFVEDIGRYDELLTDEIPGLQADIQDAINQQIELKLDAFHQEIEIRLDMAEAERDWNEFYNKVIKDIDDEDILGNAQAKLQDFMSYYKEDLDGVIQVGTQHINDILADLKTMDEGGIAKFYGEDGTNDRARALEDLQKYYEQLMSDLEAIHDLSDEIHESYVDMIGEAQEKFDEQISTFETIDSLLEHDKNVISMIYGEEAYSALSQFYDRQEDNYNKQLDFQKQQIAFWQMQMTTAEEGSDAWNAAKENWLSAVDAWNSAIETAIQNLQDKYLNAINVIFQNLNNNVTGGMGLDYVESEWDLINQNADQYLDTVNAIYKVQELQNKYLDAIDKTDSPAQQKKLNDLMKQETDYLREQDKLSEYDLERANLKYEIAMKQIALEEAQQNKTQLRLRRDSQGNYTYQYTQDDDQVASIQQEIADLYNQLYNLDADAYRGNLDEIYNVWSEFQERMAEAAQINDPEQRAAKELLIKEQYSDLINGLVEKNENLQANMYQSTMSHLFDLYNQNTANYEDMSAEQKEILDQFINEETDLSNAAFDNLFDLYNINIEGFKNMTDEQQDILMNSMIPQWESGIQQMADKIAGEGGFTGVCKDAFEELDQATKDYMTGLEELQKNADVSFEEVKNGINEVITDTEELLKDNTELIDSYGKEIEAIKGVIEELEDLIDKYEEAEAAAKKAAEEAYKYKQQEDDKNADVDPNLDKPKKDTPTTVADVPTTPTNNTPAEPPKPSLSLGSYVSVKPGTKWYADSWGGGSWGYARAGSIAYTSSGPYGYNIGGLGWVRKSDIVGYDTGGYTGDWNNNNGRLAMLHQKELVLNANDTSNMLNAITILRDITANLGATLLNKMASISASGTGSIGQGLATAGMEQTVTINAEFPNATSSREIEEALNNLVNRASQHITK